MSFSDYASTTSVRPDRPLIVKCTFDQRMKRITFASSRNCSYDLLRAKVEQCFALSATSFTIRYKDDDGEITDVTSDGDLTEAIHYFNTEDDIPTSSASSVVSGISSNSRRITLRLTVAVDYELSLSDTASLASLEEYEGPNASDLTLAREPLNVYQDGLDLEDDAVTVSSRDTLFHSLGAPALQFNSRPSLLRPLSPVLSDDSPPVSSLNDASSVRDNEIATGLVLKKGKSKASLREASSETQDHSLPSHPPRQQKATGEAEEPDLPSDVFDQLKRLEGAESRDSYEFQEAKRLSQTERGAQWLRDQNVRAIQSMFGALPEPSISDDADSMFTRDPEESLVGDLALQQDTRGKYYYTYTSSSGASQAQEETSDLLHDGLSISDSALTGNERNRNGGPSSHGLAWLADQQNAQPSSSSMPLTSNPFGAPSPARIRERFQIHPDIPPEVLKFIPEDRLPLLPPDEVTHCSSCNITLDSFRYVCTTCGELEARSRHAPPSPTPSGKGKGKNTAASTNPFLYPPTKPHTAPPSPSSSSWTLLNASDLPPLPPRSSSLQATLGKPTLAVPRSLTSQTSQDTLFVPPSDHSSGSGTQGYELCSSCIESAGVLHALEAGAGTSPHNNSPLSSPEENMRALSQLRRTAPRSKGHIRHAYREKVWGLDGWKDVEQDDTSHCSICSTSLGINRYKCASCSKFDLCRACYSQVHEIHPSHAFLSVPDRCVRCATEQDGPATLDMNGELSLKHPGVKCHHCMLDIVGARFHCAVCDSVDICSNCESAGLPGNLTSPDGGHDSSHIMIKIPYPLESTEVETASRRAISLWHGRDRPELQRPRGQRQRSSSQDSAHARTVVGSRTNNGSHSRHGSSNEDHYISCRQCRDPIVGTRYQCATCPSSPASYNLCAKCEVHSYLVHDPRHVFIKIPRVLDRPIQTPFPLLPATLYSSPAGIVSGRRIEPQAYIQSLHHRTAVCDRCIETIKGVWLHCAYCGSDLCEDCESVGMHDKTHVFLVFKSNVNMVRLGEIRNIENPARSPPIIPHPVYFSC